MYIYIYIERERDVDHVICLLIQLHRSIQRIPMMGDSARIGHLAMETSERD